MERLDFQIREYDAVFAELRQSIALQYSSLGVGIAVYGWLLKFVLESYGQNWLLCYLLSFGLPVVSILTLFIWMGEIARMRRAAIYLTGLEKSFDARYPAVEAPDHYGFHTWAKKTGSLLSMHYYAVIIFFLSAGVVGLILGWICYANIPYHGWLTSQGLLVFVNRCSDILFVGTVAFLWHWGRNLDVWNLTPPFPSRVDHNPKC